MVNNFKLIIGARSDVPSWHSKNLTHLITIRDPDVKEPYIAHFARKPKILKLIFEDRLHELDQCPPTESHVNQIIRFAEEIKIDLENGKEVICACQCFAGISRSTAAGYIVLNVLIGPNKELDIFNYMLQNIRPCMVPNILMVDYADKLLDRDGKMSSLAREYRNKFLKNNAWSSE